MWSNIILIDAASGGQLVNLRRSFGTELPQTPDKSSMTALIQSRRPQVTGLSKGPLSGEYGTRVLVPVVMDNSALRYVLVAVISPASWLELLSNYPIAPDATLTLLDQNGLIIARTLNNDRWVGQSPSPGLLEQSRKAPEAAYRNIGLEGQLFYSAHSRSKIAGWTLASGVPAAGVESVLRSSTLALATGATATVLLAVALAFVFGRRIAQPVSALARTARKLPTRAPMTVDDHSGIAEVEEVSRAFRDAAEQLKTHEKELRSQAALYARQAALLDLAHDAILVRELDDRIIFWNRGAEEMYGWKKDEALNTVAHELLQTRFPAPLEKIKAEALSASRWDGELIQRRRDGSLVYVISRWALQRDSAGRAVSILEMNHDVTEQRRHQEDLERRVAERTRELERTVAEREKLQEQLLQSQKMESLGTLAGGVAHDFNNILNIILGYASTIAAEAQSANLADGLTVIRQAAERGAALIQQLLTVARKSPMEFEPVDVNHQVSELAGLLHETFPKTIAVVIDADADLPRVHADPNRLHQALLNLAVNARDAMPDGGTLTFKTGIIAGAVLKKQSSRAGTSDYVSIAVTDTGSGIEPSVRERIFDPFFTTKEHGKGTGLGLTVAYGIVGGHDGFIDCTSAGSHGTTFRIYLPVRALEVYPEPPDSQTSNGVMRTPESATVLFVDDEERQAELMQSFLENRGHRVLVAQDGIEAVSLYSRHKREIDVVVLDLGLPRLGGWEAFLRMKQEDAEVKAIFASGYINTDVKAQMMRHGAAAIIHKPYLPEEISEQIIGALRRGPATDAE
jgi:PAS domain S-box-containing protein